MEEEVVVVVIVYSSGVCGTVVVVAVVLSCGGSPCGTTNAGLGMCQSMMDGMAWARRDMQRVPDGRTGRDRARSGILWFLWSLCQVLASQSTQ